MSFIYRYIHHIPNTEHPPKLPGISFNEIFQIKNLSTLSLDAAEAEWNQHHCLVFVLDYNNTFGIYYVLLPDYMYDIITKDYERILLVEPFQSNSGAHDIYIIPSLYHIFIERFEKRLRTRKYLNVIQRTIPFPPTELAYHQQLSQKVCTNSLMDGYELSLLRKYVNESLDIIRDEKDYRPGGKKMLELQQSFEELVLLMTPI